MTKHPEFTPIKSSMMTGYAYDPDSRALTIDPVIALRSE